MATRLRYVTECGNVGIQFNSPHWEICSADCQVVPFTVCVWDSKRTSKERAADRVFSENSKHSSQRPRSEISIPSTLLCSVYSRVIKSAASTARTAHSVVLRTKLLVSTTLQHSTVQEPTSVASPAAALSSMLSTTCALLPMDDPSGEVALCVGEHGLPAVLQRYVLKLQRTRCMNDVRLE